MSLTIAELAFDAEDYIYGDGRRSIKPGFGYIRARGSGYPGRPKELRVSQAQHTIRRLIEDGSVAHGPLGSTCWVIQDWAQITGRHVTIAEHWLCGKVVGYTSTLHPQ